MKWICGETKSSKVERREKRKLEEIREKQKPHRWFAWYPVVLQTVSIENKIKKERVWLEFVERTGYYNRSFSIFTRNWDYTYRQLDWVEKVLGRKE